MLRKLTTQQKGRCGELFVQYMLLKHGIESAALTTDTGVDLIAYRRVPYGVWTWGRPVTIQIKASPYHQWKKEDLYYLEWSLRENSFPVDFICLVDLERNKLWLFTWEDFEAKSIGKKQPRLWWPPPEYDYASAPRHEKDFSAYEMDDGIRKAFGST
jgi:hypothetical protein